MASVSSRYARAFADVVIDLKLDPNQVREELRAMVETVEGSPELRRVWESPAIPHEQKNALLDAIARRAGLVTPVRNFLAVLIEHGRMPMLAQIARQFELELNQRLGFTEAEITSARELTPQERAAMEAQIAKLTGRKVRAKYGTDRQILGGAVVRVGSTIYDGSLRGQLRRIKEELVEV
jgi:F-type H+-transporting ATPase subunit delta